MLTKFNLNRSKTKIMLVKDQNKDKPCIMYSNEPIELTEYLGLKVP